MNAVTGQVSHSAADVYEAFFVPALFQSWCARVADAAAVAEGQQVLDVACGTGVLAREFSRRVGMRGSVTGLDINDGMLAVAKRKAADVTWRQGAAEALPFDNDSFDAVASQFGLMFFSDRARAIGEMARVLRPGGRLAVAVWDSLERTPGYAAVCALLHKLFGASVADAIRAPFVLGDSEVLKPLFDTPLLSEVTVCTQQELARFASIRDWMYTDIKGWTLAEMLDDEQYDLLLTEAGKALGQFVEADGSVVFPAPAHIVSARKA